MLVRTRPTEPFQSLVTEAQASQIDAEWVQHHRMQRVARPDPAQLEVEREALRKKLGTEPKEADVVWSLLHKQRQCHAQERNWSLYRNSMLEMAQRLLVEEKHLAALAYLLDVCAIDAWLEEELEHANNLTSTPIELSFAPGVLSMIDEAIEGSKATSGDIESILTSRRVKLTMLAHWRVTPATLHDAIREALTSFDGGSPAPLRASHLPHPNE